ncbi:hypothetical protein F5141DRAFT_1067212 [Pisolithus sp. B1]|nr:hypothetical protein F5141DRAFT_1067212 [Pisolithus sp. B1]
MIWSETAQLMDGPVQQMSQTDEASAMNEAGWHNSWAGPSMIRYETVQLMDWLAKQMKPGQTDAVGWHNLWAGPSAIWSENGATHGWASATNEVGWHNSWAGPSIRRNERVELMDGPAKLMGWPVHDMEIYHATEGWTSITGGVWLHNSQGGPVHDMNFAWYNNKLSQAPCGWCMQLTDKIADYMQSQFWEEALTGQCTLPDISIPLPLTQETASPLQYDEIMEATVVLDGNGNIKLWRFTFIPETNMVFTQQNGGSTEGQPQAFKKLWMADRHGLKGSIDLSPGWYQQGHGPPNFHPEVSWLLKAGREQNGTWQWVDQMSEFHALLSGALAVMHPYVNGQQQWLDMLITVGDYPPLDFVITTLNLWLRYNPGTIIAMPGSVLEHGVGYA